MIMIVVANEFIIISFE